jgi:hypothetical protein
MKNKLLIILAIGLISCEVTEPIKPVNVSKLKKVYSVTNWNNPQYLPNIGNTHLSAHTD